MALHAASPSAVVPEAELLALAAELKTKIEVERSRLRAALLAGERTFDIRTGLAELEDRAGDVGRELTRIAGELLDQAAAEAEAVARLMANGMEVRLAALIASLQPPPPPMTQVPQAAT